MHPIVATLCMSIIMQIQSILQIYNRRNIQIQSLPSVWRYNIIDLHKANNGQENLSYAQVEK